MRYSPGEYYKGCHTTKRTYAVEHDLRLLSEFREQLEVRLERPYHSLDSECLKLLSFLLRADYDSDIEVLRIWVFEQARED